MDDSFPIRTACPAGACACGRDELLADPAGDFRILRLTKTEERKLIERLESMQTLDDLRRMQARMTELLGLEVIIAPGLNEVRTVRGFSIRVEERPGLCSKVRQSIPAAIRRCLERQPEIAYAILNEHDLLSNA
jgi:hypothetical protein